MVPDAPARSKGKAGTASGATTSTTAAGATATAASPTTVTSTAPTVSNAAQAAGNGNFENMVAFTGRSRPHLIRLELRSVTADASRQTRRYAATLVADRPPGPVPIVRSPVGTVGTRTYPTPPNQQERLWAIAIDGYQAWVYHPDRHST